MDNPFDVSWDDGENMPPNTSGEMAGAGRTRRKNPFRSSERDKVAFPPLDRALSRERDDGGEEEGEDGNKDEEAECALSISMQALLHPDSFSSMEGESSEDGEGDDAEGAVWAGWGVGGGLSSSSLPSGHRGVLPTTPEQHGLPACLQGDWGSREDGEDGEESGSDDSAEPCMAEFYAAMRRDAAHLSPLKSEGGSSQGDDGDAQRHRRGGDADAYGCVDDQQACTKGNNNNNNSNNNSNDNTNGAANNSTFGDGSWVTGGIDESTIGPCPFTPERPASVMRFDSAETMTPIPLAMRTPSREGGGGVCIAMTPTTPASVLKVI